MQLSLRAMRFGLWLGALVASSALAPTALAQSHLDATSTIYYESGGPLEMQIVTPSVDGRAELGGGVSLDAAWEADVVSGASVAVVDAPGDDVDAVTSATRLDDLRNVFTGGLAVQDTTASVSAHYSYGFENDYVSHALSLSAGSEVFDRNTALEIAYARNWDSVCDLRQPDAESPVERARLPSSEGCFGASDRDEHSVDVHTIQGTWTQAWTPIFNTQLVVTAQVLRGFQSNPYRAVWLGRTAAQEHHPNDRARYALGLRARLWIKPLGGALQLFGRAYRDTWDVASGTGEAAFERNLGDWLRFRLRGRYYYQTAAAFFSDDYVLAPAGQYFTGDRELSPMSSYLLGGKVALLPLAAREQPGRVSEFAVIAKADALFFDFRAFHYGFAEVPTKRAVFGTLSFELTF